MKPFKTSRASWWDYSNEGAYFITISTKEHKHYFGYIDMGKPFLSEVGRIAYHFWLNIPRISKGVELGEFIVMPHHLHGILFLNKSFDPNEQTTKSISTIIGSYKAAVSKECKLKELEFAWDRRFHDRIIRNNDELQAIENYIRENPKRWISN